MKWLRHIILKMPNRYMSRDYMMLHTTYLFLNRNALSEDFRNRLHGNW